LRGERKKKSEQAVSHLLLYLEMEKKEGGGAGAGAKAQKPNTECAPPRCCSLKEKKERRREREKEERRQSPPSLKLPVSLLFFKRSGISTEARRPAVLITSHFSPFIKK